MKPHAWASSQAWRANQLLSAAQFKSCLPKNRADFDVPLYAVDAPTLLSALELATQALAGGLWDFGPGQDEHSMCAEVIATCRAVINKATEPQQ